MASPLSPSRRVARAVAPLRGGGSMHGRREILLALGVLAILTGSSSGAAALVDDFETDFWLPYTDFLLGDKASAGYSSTYVRSGTRSYHVDVSGYSILDFGSAYGYAVYATRGAAVTELRVSFLCTAGLAGASYSMYFDDFMLDTGAGDADGDGLSDLDEETRVYVMSVTSGFMPTAVPAAGTATIDVHAPPVEGLVQWAGIGMEIDHPRPNDLSVEVSLPDRPGSPSQLLWDPGFHARGAAILEPAS